MDRQIENRDIKTAAKLPYSSGHLMCRTPLWGIAGFLGSAYFAWVSFSHLLRKEYYWPHDWWTAATYVVWILLLTGLMLETRCLRERIFFAFLVLNFVIGFGLTLWHDARPPTVLQARLITGTLWAIAALVSLTTLRGTPEQPRE